LFFKELNPGLLLKLGYSFPAAALPKFERTCCNISKALLFVKQKSDLLSMFFCSNPQRFSEEF